MAQQFVTAFNGARDHYELPLALYEMGLLHRHISDFYCPDALAGVTRIPERIRNRRASGLPSRSVRVDLWPAIQRQLSSSKDDGDPYFTIDRTLSMFAAKVALRSESHLFLHSRYAYWAFKALPDRKRLMYQYHPHARSVKEILEKDYLLHPEIRSSFEDDQNSQFRTEAHAEWEMADGIVCASSFTKASLVQQGCSAHRIFVVPYEAPTDAFTNVSHAQQQGHCRFIFVGQGVQRKGLHHLLKAWKVADLKDAELIVVASKLDPGLRALVDQTNVRYFAGVSARLLKSLYQQASVFVMPSLVEGFGWVYLEALAAGLHCIGTANTGLPDLNLPADCVSIVPAGVLPTLVEALTATAERFRRGGVDKAAIQAAVRGLRSRHPRARLRSTIAEMVGGSKYKESTGIPVPSLVHG